MTCHGLNAHAREKGLDAGSGTERAAESRSRSPASRASGSTELDRSTRGQGVHDLGNDRLNSSRGRRVASTMGRARALEDAGGGANRVTACQVKAAGPPTRHPIACAGRSASPPGRQGGGCRTGTAAYPALSSVEVIPASCVAGGDEGPRLGVISSFHCIQPPLMAASTRCRSSPLRR
jgi:hypothetical protein